MNITHLRGKNEVKSSTLDKKKKHDNITSYEGYEEEMILREYVTSFSKTGTIIKKAQTPMREELIKNVNILNDSKLEYRTIPVIENGQQTMEIVPEIDKKDLLKITEQIYANEFGLIDPRLALKISQQINVSSKTEKMKTCIATTMGTSLMIYEWIQAQDPRTKERKYIQTWVPIYLTTPQYDEHMRLWLRDKKWQEYTKNEREIFQMQNVSFKISHYWMLVRIIDNHTERRQYKVLPNSFTILIPQMLLLRFPNLNKHQNDVLVQSFCEVTNDIKEAMAKELNSNQAPPSRYDTSKTQTSLIDRMLGKKDDGPKRPKEMDMMLDTSILNDEIKNKILECHSYVINAALSDEHLTVFDTIFTQLSDKLEPSDTMIKMLEEISVPKRKYHLLAFLPNSNNWFRYGYNALSRGFTSKDVRPHWIPLSYRFRTTNNPRGIPKLNDICDDLIEEICENITGYNGYEMRPRIYAIGLKTETGYRILNRQIFDIFTYSMPEDIDILDEQDYMNEFREKRKKQELLQISTILPDKPERKYTDNIDARSLGDGNETDKSKVKIIYNNFETFEVSSNMTEDSPSNDTTTIDTSASNAIETNNNINTVNRSPYKLIEVENLKENEITSQRNKNINSINCSIEAPSSESDNTIDNNNDHKLILQKRGTEEDYFTIFVLKKHIKTFQEPTNIDVKYNEIILTTRNCIRTPKSPPNNKDSSDSYQYKKFKKADSKLNFGKNVGEMERKLKTTPKTANFDADHRKKACTLSTRCDNAVGNEWEEPEMNDIQRNRTKGMKKDEDPTTTNKTGEIDTKNYHDPICIVPKYISPLKIQRFNEILKKLNSSSNSKIDYWLSIGEQIQINAFKKTDKTKSSISETMKQQRAQRFFDKGNTGKAFEMLMGNTKENIIPTENDLNKLYPNNMWPSFDVKKNNAPFVVNDNLLDCAIKTLKNGKVAGISQLSAEHIKQLYTQDIQRNALRDTIQNIINNPEKAPDQLFTTRLTCIPKSSGGIRPLSVEETLLKLTNRIVNNVLVPKITQCIDTSQTCLSGTNAQMNAVEKLKDIINDDNNNSNDIYVAQIDMSNAFGTIAHQTILKALKNIKGIERLTYYISIFLKRMRIQYCTHNDVKQFRDLNRGVPQGDPLSMTLFALGLDYVIKEVKKHNKSKSLSIVAYADDVIIITHSEKEMEAIMKKYKEKANEAGLQINPTKTKYYTTNNKTSDKYQSLHNNVIEYLGIPISLNQLKMDEHVNEYINNIYSQAETVWNSKYITLQMKFHIHQTCILSKLIYLFRGTDIKTKIDVISNKLEELYKDLFLQIPIEIMRLPIILGGLGMLYLDDIRQISRLSYLLEIGKRKEIPEILKPYINEEKILNKEGEMQHLITQAYYKRQRDRYLNKLASNKKQDKHLILMLDEKQSKSAHSLLVSAPTNVTQTMDDYTFKLCIALRYHIDILEHSDLRCKKCNDDASLWHILRCAREQMKNNIYIHEKIKFIIGATLKRNKEIINVRYEQLSTQDENEKEKGGKHIPDILLSFINGKEHALDICIESKFCQRRSSGYEPTKGLKRKERQYKGTKCEVHPIAFDNSGRINSSSWEYLKNMGIRKGILKYIQVLIMKSNSYALKKISEKNIGMNEKDLRKRNGGMQIDEAALNNNE